MQPISSVNSIELFSRSNFSLITNHSSSNHPTPSSAAPKTSRSISSTEVSAIILSGSKPCTTATPNPSLQRTIHVEKTAYWSKLLHYNQPLLSKAALPLASPMASVSLSPLYSVIASVIRHCIRSSTLLLLRHCKRHTDPSAKTLLIKAEWNGWSRRLGLEISCARNEKDGWSFGGGRAQFSTGEL